MKKRIFYLQHVLQMILLTRTFYMEYVPLSIFIVTAMILLRVKYQIEGYTPLTLLLIIFLLVEAVGESYSLVYLQYVGSILGGLLYFVPLKLYWLPQQFNVVGFREEYIQGKLHYFEFYPLDQEKQIKMKSMKWTYGKELEKFYESEQISNNLVKKIAGIALSHTQKHKLKVGNGTELKASASIAFSHGKGATPLFYSLQMMHFASEKYRVGTVQHNEKSYIRLTDRAVIKDFRERQVVERAKQTVKVIEKVDNERIILMGHSYGCSTLLQAYYTLSPELKAKVTHIVLLDPWLFPLKEDTFNQKIQIPLLMIANEDFVHFQPVYEANKQFSEKHQVEYIILKDAHHLHQTDTGFVIGNFMGIVKNSVLSRQQMEINLQTIDRFLKGQKVEWMLGDKDLGRDFKPIKFHKQDLRTW